MPRSKRRQSPQNLRQTSLFESYGQRPPSSPGKTLSSPVSSPSSKRRRPRDESVSHVSDSEEDRWKLDGIEFEKESSSSAETLDLTLVSPRKPNRKKRRIMDSDEELPPSSSQTLLFEDDDDITAVSRKGKGKAKVIDLSLDDGVPEPSRRKRKLVKGKRPATPEANDEDTDLADEVEQERIIEPRLRSRKKLSTFQQNLAKLKRRKLRESKAGYSTSETGSLSENHEETADNQPFQGARPSTRSDNSHSSPDEGSDEDEQSFIVEDDGPRAELPAEFSMNTYQDLMHHFKTIFQFFVHIAVQPPRKREGFMRKKMKDEEYFHVPLEIARRKISGMKDSLIASSVWKPEFKRTLERFPEFKVHALKYAVPSCDACHLGGRKSTMVGRLGGSPYNRCGFEPLEGSKGDDDSDSSDSEQPEDVKTELNLGRFCAKRVRVYHAFSHWELTLFQSIDQEISELRSRSKKKKKKYVKVSYAEGLHPPEDLTDADGLCDWLDQRRVIEIQWEDFKQMMESANHLEMRVGKNKDDDDD